MDINQLKHGLILYLILLGSLSVHEWAHAFAAHCLGDDTAAKQGRLTFNPLAHMDLFGTVLIPLAMILLSPGFAIIGWAKPVPFDPSNLRNRKWGDILISMAGPLSNLFICLLMALVGGVVLRFTPQAGDLLGMVIWINALLMVFNLLPIPPLDGSHVLKHLVRMSEETYIKFAQWGFVVLIVMINIPLFQVLIFKALSFVFAGFAVLGGSLAGVDPAVFIPFD